LRESPAQDTNRASLFSLDARNQSTNSPPEPLAQREDDTVRQAPRIVRGLGQARDGQEEFHERQVHPTHPHPSRRLRRR